MSDLTESSIMSSVMITPEVTDIPDVDSLSPDELRALVRQQLAIIESKKKLGINFTFEPDTGFEVRNLGTPGMVPSFVKKAALSTLTAFGAEDHILIEGDNLPAVTAYLAAGGCLADVIYIDPPYNTGEDANDGSFVYNDRRVSAKDAYYHSAWLSFMLPRLVLGRDALRDTGTIMVHIGKDEHHRLRMLMDEVFGEENFVEDITWGGGIKNDARFFSSTSDYALVYAKNKRTLIEKDVRWRAAKPGLDDMMDAAARIWDELTSGEEPSKALAFKATKLFKAWMKTDAASTARAGDAKHYTSIDEGGRLYHGFDISAASGEGDETRRYEVLHPITEVAIPVPARGWPTRSTFDRWLAEDRILFGADETTVPKYKRYLEETSKSPLRDTLLKDRRGATRELAALLGKGPDGKPLFNNPKDRTVLAQWIDYVTPQFRKEQSATDPIVVMDFFAGSGTTGHAVLDLNAQDDVRRKFVLITNNEDPKADDDNAETGVARDVTSVRLRNAITGQWADGKAHEGYEANLHYYKQSWADLGTEKYGRAVRFQGRFAGLAAVATGAHWTAADLGEVVNSAHADYAVLRSPHDGGTTLVIWNNYDAIRDDSGEGYDDEPSGVIREFFEGNSDAHRIAYVPSPGTAAPFQVGGATETRAYPTEYLARLDAHILRLMTEAGLQFG